MSTNQNSPSVIVGTMAERPRPGLISIGTTFHGTDSAQSYVLVTDTATGDRRWQLISNTGVVYTFSGFRTTSETPEAPPVVWFSNSLQNLNGAPVDADTSTDAPVEYDVLAASSSQLLSIRVLGAFEFGDCSMGLYRRPSGSLADPVLIGSVVIPAASVPGRRFTLELEQSFSVGDTVSVGLILPVPPVTGDGFVFTAVLSLAP